MFLLNWQYLYNQYMDFVDSWTDVRCWPRPLIFSATSDTENKVFREIEFLRHCVLNDFSITTPRTVAANITTPVSHIYSWVLAPRVERIRALALNHLIPHYCEFESRSDQTHGKQSFPAFGWSGSSPVVLCGTHIKLAWWEMCEIFLKGRKILSKRRKAVVLFVLGSVSVCCFDIILTL